jgi:D-3-phosphoglycerate dehydrogenase
MSHFNILISDPLHPQAVAWLQKQTDVQLSVRPSLSREELLKVIGGYEAIIVRSRTKVDAAVIEAGRKLKVIARAGTGLDNIDVKAAEQRQIQIINAPGANANAVAELTLALMLEMARDLHAAFHVAKERQKMSGYGSELKEKTLGLLGFGQIGKRVAQLALAFEMRVIAYDIILAPRPGVEFVSLERLWRESDFLSLHLPLTEQTRQIINAGVIAQLKPGVFLINTARAELVDEAAVLAALESGQIQKYAADLYAPASPLLAHQSARLTPHIGASTAEAQQRAGQETVEQVIQSLRCHRAA